MPDVKSFEIFCRVVETGGVSAAARALGLTQSAVTRRIQALETELGCPLFSRKSPRSGLTPLPCARTLYSYAIKLVADLESARAALSEHGDGAELSGTLVIAAAQTKAIEPLLSAWARLSQKHPAAKLELIDCNAERARSLILKGRASAGLFLTPADLRGLGVRSLPYRGAFGLLMTQDVRASFGEAGSLAPADLTPLKLAIPKHRASLNELTRWLGFSARRLTVKATYELIGNAVALAQTGLSILCLAELASQYPEFDFLPLEPPVTVGAAVGYDAEHVADDPLLMAWLTTLDAVIAEESAKAL